MDSTQLTLTHSITTKSQDREPREPRGDNFRSNRRGPPPVVNKRFADLADEEREKLRVREDRRTERFQERERGPPPTQNSRFSRAVEADGDYVRPEDRQALRENTRGEGLGGDDRGGDRGDRDFGRGGGEDPLMQRGPPPMVQNSRFAAAAKEMESEREVENRDRDERRMMRGPPRDRDGGMDSQGPPPMPTNSRFAAVVAEHQVEKEREMMERGDRQRQYDDRQSGGMGGGRDGGDRQGGGMGGGRYDDRQSGGMGGGDRQSGGFGGGDRQSGGFGGGDRQSGGRYGDRYGDDRGDRQSGAPGGRFGGGRMDRGPAAAPFDHDQVGSTRTTFIKPELPSHLQPKKAEEPVFRAEETTFTLPGEDEEAAKARIEKKRRDEDEKRLVEQKAAEEAAAKQAEAEVEAAEKAKQAAALEGDLLSAFVNSGKSGDDLKAWCQEQGVILPSVEKLVYHLLITTQKEDPKPDCTWAEAANYGAALASLVEENSVGMKGVLFAVQRFCHAIGFPKIGNEGLIQSMFRNMYKFDLADEDAFSEWKDDESPAREAGKGKAIIQTMDWFNWLDEDDESEEEDYEEEEYEE